MNKQLTASQDIAQKDNLSDIIDNANDIAKLAKRMRENDIYITEHYLGCLVDDAESIIDLVRVIASRSDYKELYWL